MYVAMLHVLEEQNADSSIHYALTGIMCLIKMCFVAEVCMASSTHGN